MYLLGCAEAQPQRMLRAKHPGVRASSINVSTSFGEIQKGMITERQQLPFDS